MAGMLMFSASRRVQKEAGVAGGCSGSVESVEIASNRLFLTRTGPSGKALAAGGGILAVLFMEGDAAGMSSSALASSSTPTGFFKDGNTAWFSGPPGPKCTIEGFLSAISFTVGIGSSLMLETRG